MACGSGVPDRPRAVIVRHKSSTIVSLDVDPPAYDGGERVIGYRVEYDHNKVQEFQTGMLTMLTRAETIQIFAVLQ